MLIFINHTNIYNVSAMPTEKHVDILAKEILQIHDADNKTTQHKATSIRRITGNKNKTYIWAQKTSKKRIL